MITQKTISVYKFEDLTDTAKERALDKHREINVSDDYWLDDEFISEKIKEDLKLDINYKEVFFEMFSRSNCIYIKSDVVTSALCKKYPEIYSFDLPEKFGGFCSYLGGGLCSGLHYSDFNIDYLELEEDTDKVKAVMIKKAVEGDLKRLQQILEEYYKGLYEQHNYLISDEAVADTLIANEYEFEENGDCL